jgi:uncharacterized protein (TIGR03032 family)
MTSKAGATDPAKGTGDADPGATAGAQLSSLAASRGFAAWLGSVRASLAFTSYQTGQLFLVGVRKDGKISFNQQSFGRAMGVCGDGNRLFVGTLAQIWRLENVLASQERANTHFDRLLVPRAAVTIGDVDAHELAIDRFGRTIFVNTKFSCLATVSQTHSFRPLWKPSFISKLAAEDRCHLNGLCLVDGVPRYVTAVRRSDLPDGWRERRHEGGVLIDIHDDRVVSDTLSIPHSPRWFNGTLWALDSGRGFLIRIDPETGASDDIAFCPGFLRGLSFHRGYAVVTASLPREGSFSGLQLDASLKARDGEPRCGVFVINLRHGDIVEWIRIEGPVRELFDVTVLPDVQCPMSIGLAAPELRSMITIEAGFAPLIPAPATP